MIQAKIVADSIANDIRLTTFELLYPRFIHAEFMTHRVFSRNASSSRAIPIKKILKEIRTDYARPVFWGKNQAGMQAFEELETGRKHAAQQCWQRAMQDALHHAAYMEELGAHKQIVNRLTEPFQHIAVVVTSTDYDNFFHLRLDVHAQPEIQALARRMYDLYRRHLPEELVQEQWHLPYLTGAELEDVDTAKDPLPFVKMSVARCARVSYKNHDGTTPTPADDFKLYDRLVGSDPKHASPAEHQATPDIQKRNGQWMYPREHGNLHGWRQHRKRIQGERFTQSFIQEDSTVGVFED